MRPRRPTPMPAPPRRLRPWTCTRRARRRRAGWPAATPGDGGAWGSCGGLQGCGEIDGTGEQGLSEDDAGDAGLAHAAQTVEVTDPAGDEDLGIVRPNERTHPLMVRRPAAVGQDEPPDTSPDELFDEALDGRRRGSAP